MNSESDVTLSPDTFLMSLGLGSVETELKSVDQRMAIFSLVRELAHARGWIVKEPSASVATSADLPFRIPGTAYTVRLSQPASEEIAALVATAFLLIGDGEVDTQTIAVGAIMALTARIKKLNVDEGERSVIDVLQRLRPPTAAAITLALHGRPCRYPESACRFREPDNGRCAITVTQASATAEALYARNILRHVNAAEPFEYAIVL
ncbi:hypothetical protein [Micromonospora globbae]|uniref:hypothetical protein n=1 Tax=Micromonospora globbae TaxID=1894969 RepID=UPI0038689C6B|nr:hypothetical protein OH732_07790 [Micromonospora globbae]